MGLYRSEGAVEFCRYAYAVRTLLFQSIGKANGYTLTAYYGNVHILIEGLRRTEST